MAGLKFTIDDDAQVAGSRSSGPRPSNTSSSGDVYFGRVTAIPAPPPPPKPAESDEGFWTKTGRAALGGLARAGGALVEYLPESIETGVAETSDILASGLGLPKGLVGGIVRAQTGQVVTPENVATYRKAVEPVSSALTAEGRRQEQLAGPGKFLAPSQQKDFSLTETLGYGAEQGLRSSGSAALGLGAGLLTRSPGVARAVMGAGSYGQTMAGVLDSQQEQGFQDVSLAAKASLASAALDVLTGGEAKVAQAASKEIQQQLFRQGAKNLTKDLLKIGAGEAATEVVQTGFERYGARKELFSRDAINDYIDSAAGGFGGGVVMGGGVRLLTGNRKAAENKPIPEDAGSDLLKPAGEQGAALPPVASPSFIVKDDNDNDVVNMDTVRANPRMALDELGQLYSRDNIITSLAGETEADEFTKSLGARLHRAINSPNAKSIPNLVRNLKRDIDADMHGEEVAAQRAPLVAKAALMLGDYVALRNEAMAADERATNPALVAETAAQNNASEVERVQAVRQQEQADIAAEQARVDAERKMQLDNAAKEVEGIHRKGFLEAVAKDPKTRDPVARFTALLKRNGFNPEITAQEQIELTKAAVGAEQRLASEAAQMDMTVAEYKQKLAEDEARQQQAESGTASMEAQIREAGSRAPAVTLAPKPEPMPAGKTNRTTPENFQLEMQRELTDADIEAQQKAAARRQAKEDRALAKSNERAERRAAKQGEMFTPTGRVRKATAAPKVTVSAKLKEKARAAKEGQKPESRVSERQRTDEKRAAPETGRGNRVEQIKAVAEKRQKVKPQTPAQKLAKVKERAAAAKAEQEARIEESKAKEQAAEVPNLEGQELYAYQNVSGQIDTALEMGEITPMQSRTLKALIATRVEPGAIQQAVKDAAEQNKSKAKTTGAKGAKLKESTREERAALTDELQRELERLGLNKVGLGVVADLIETAQGKAEGSYQAGSTPEARSGFRALINIVFNDLTKALETLHHEAIHYMRDANLITEGEWATLTAIVKADKNLMAHVRDNWKGLSEESLIEEAVAEKFREWMRTQKAIAPGIRGVFQRMRNFFNTVRLGFNKPAFAETKAIFQSINAGERNDKNATSLRSDAISTGTVKLSPVIETRLENENVPPLVGGQTSFVARKFNELYDKFARKAMTHTLIEAAIKAGLKYAGVYQDIELDKQRVRYKIEQRISKILEGFDSLPATLKQIGGPINTLLQDSTMSGKWAFEPSNLKEGTYEVDPELQDRYNALPAEGKKFIREVFEANAELRQQLMDTVDAAIDEPYDRLIQEAEAAKDAKQVANLKREREGLRAQKTMMFRVDPTKPYASLRRQGEFAVSAKSEEYIAAQEAKDNKLIQELQSAPEHNFFNKYETEAEAKAEVKRLKELGLYSDVIATTDDTVVNEIAGGRETFQAFQRIFKALEDRDGLSEQAKRTLQSVITDLHVMSMSNSSARKSEVKRKNVYGGDLDMVRNFAIQSRAMAYHIASLKNNDMLMEAINGMNKEVRSAPDTMEASKFRDEILLRHMSSLRATPNNFVESMKRLTAIYKIAFSPSFYIQNFTQVPMMVGPELAARGGLTKAVKLINGGMEEVAKAWKDTKWTESLNIDALPEDVRGVVQRLADISLIDVGLDADLGNMQSLRGRAGERWGQTGESLDKAMQVGVAATNIAQDLTRKQESINRTVTAIAAYRLELERTGSTQKALDYATSLVRNTMGTYDGFNAPRYMQGVGGIPFQFRKFQLMQITLLMRHMQNGFTDPNITPEERAIARQALKYQLGTAAMIGGIRALPGAAALIWLYNTFFGDDDEPAEADDQIRKAVGDETLSDLLLYGVPSLADINLSGMLGFGNAFSILPYTKLEATKEGVAKAAFDLAGAGPATLRDIGLAAVQTYDGLMEGREDYYRGLEKMLPKGFTNAVTAYREATEGVTSYRDDKLISKDDVTYFDTIKTLLGVQSVKTSERFRKQEAEKVLDQFFKDKTSKLKRQYVQALDNNQPKRREEIKAEWRKMQDARDKQGKKRQPISILLKAKAEQARREEMTVGGVQYRAKDERYRQALLDQAEED